MIHKEGWVIVYDKSSFMDPMPEEIIVQILMWIS